MRGWLRKAMIGLGFSVLLIGIGYGYAIGESGKPDTQQYPTKPINILVSVAPGGTRDTSTRILASKAEKFLGQPFMISNNGGAAGTVAMGIIARERPDGYHLVGCSSVNLIQSPQLRTVTYKLDDFIPILHYGAPQTGIVVKADSPWKTFKEFVEYAKNNPGKINYSSVGVNSAGHLAMEFLARTEGIQWTHVPFTGGVPAITALLGGHVTAESGTSEWIPHIQSGSLRLLATHGEKRMKIFPKVPTFKELGYNFVSEVLHIFAAPKGTPTFIIKKLENAFSKAVDDPEFIQMMNKMNIDITYRNAEDTKKYLQEAYDDFGKMIIDLKIPRQAANK